MHDIEEIVRGCQKYHKSSQKKLYEHFAPKIKGICLRYSKSSNDAKDILQEAFLKVFMNIEKYQWKGPFEGWLKRIVINTAIDFLKKKNSYDFTSITNDGLEYQNHLIIENLDDNGFQLYETLDLNENELLNIINNLPLAFSTVFNLYCIEEYSHEQIAEMLNINTSTSRSRLTRARKMIQEKIEDLSRFNNKIANYSMVTGTRFN